MISLQRTRHAQRYISALTGAADLIMSSCEASDLVIIHICYTARS